MGTEIERKFLVNGLDWKKNVQGTRYRQGYLTLDPARTVRVRTAGDTGYLTIKGKSNGISRREFEYEIPYADASAMLDGLCIQPLIEKNRYRIEYQGLVWEVDEFLGENSGLVIAEIELDREDQPFSNPAWAGREVSGDPRYFNASLVQKPWNTWHD
ncbi:MAG: CYTH domain-containing protein [Desulfobulbaceae bacterium]|nr:CYTH domain-containing protein [Desulfobulbaceae bacterium]